MGKFSSDMDRMAHVFTHMVRAEKAGMNRDRGFSEFLQRDYWAWVLPSDYYRALPFIDRVDVLTKILSDEFMSESFADDYFVNDRSVVTTAGPINIMMFYPDDTAWSDILQEDEEDGGVILFDLGDGHYGARFICTESPGLLYIPALGRHHPDAGTIIQLVQANMKHEWHPCRIDMAINFLREAGYDDFDRQGVLPLMTPAPPPPSEPPRHAL